MAIAEGIRKLKRLGFITIALILVLAGCRSGNTADPTAEEPGIPTVTKPPTSSVRVGKWNTAEIDDEFWVFGELLNTGWNAVHNIETDVILRDENGEVLRRGKPSHVTTLPAGDKGFFYVSFEGVNPDDIDEVTFSVGAEPGISSRLYTDYAMLDLAANEESDGSIVVSGVVQNLGAVRAESVHVFVIGYDEDGQVVLVQHGISALEGIGPGQTWVFEELDFGGIGVSLPRTLDSFLVGSLP